MPTLSQVRQALAEQIRTFVGDDVEVKPYGLFADSSLPKPRVSIEMRTTADSATFGNEADAVILVVVEAGGTSEDDLQLEMDRLTDPTLSENVPAAIRFDPTLGGLVASCYPGVTDHVNIGRAEIECRVMFL